MTATAIYVAYGTTDLDLGWLPPDAPVVVVHNDDRLRPMHPEDARCQDLWPDRNLGFGGGANLALPHVGTDRVVLCNPDTRLDRRHWDALVDARGPEVVTVSLATAEARPTSVLNRYPTPLTLVLTAYRAGCLLDRARVPRAFLVKALLGRWGRAHAAPLVGAPVPLAEHWVSGAVLSVSTSRLRAVGGFDTGYFLYFEDVDLCRRLARLFPEMTARIAPTEAGVHTVGGAATDCDRRAVARHRFGSARRYAASQPGVTWGLCRLLLLPRHLWLTRR